MSLALAATLASAIKPKSDRTPAAKPTSISDSIAQKPLQWLVVVGAVVYFGGKFIKKVIPTGNDVRKGEAETTTSAENPWSAITFLNQKVPANTNLLSATGAAQLAYKVFDALSNVFYDDADIAVGVFAGLPSKIQVAQVVKSFEAKYSRNILEFLQSGDKTFDFGTGGLSYALYNRILENVKRKPKF